MEKYYDIKYCLSLGIREGERPTITPDFDPDKDDFRPFDDVWHIYLSREEAVNQANFIKEKKIKSLEKKLLKLKAMRF